MTGEWRELHKEEIHNLTSDYRNECKVLHLAPRDMSNASEVLVGSLKGKDYLGDLGIDGTAEFR